MKFIGERNFVAQLENDQLDADAARGFPHHVEIKRYLGPVRSKARGSLLWSASTNPCAMLRAAA